MERIFEAGFKEFLKLKGRPGSDISTLLDGTRRAMKATYQREMDTLESHLSFLATVGSVSPYIGLLGTVWGIMNAFRGLSNVAQATLSQVAPGIAEALVATAMGLFAAIPAVIAYNRFTHDIDRLAGSLRELHGGAAEHPATPGAPARSRHGRHRRPPGQMSRPRRAMAEINVVPYIDVMLVLLIIFMVAAPLINPGQIDLPQAAQKLDPAVAPLEVRVRMDGELAVVDRNRSPDELRVGRGQLLQFVRDAQRTHPEQAVVIAGDRNVRYEEVLTVLDLLQQGQVKRVGLLARPAQ
jgi:TolR protein